MKLISKPQVMEAAVYALISGRCHQAYLHDMRGELQTLHSAVELMVRASKGSSEHAALAEKASSLAKRTIANYEASIVKLVEQMTPQGDVRCPVEVGDLISSVIRFLRNDAARRSVSFVSHSAPSLVVSADPNKFRLYFLGLMMTSLDELEPHSVIDINVYQSAGAAVIEVTSNMPRTPIVDVNSIWQQSDRPLAAYTLVLSLAKQWLEANGGGLQFMGDNPLPTGLRMTYPGVAG